jgi:hypothetical protein
MGRSYALRGLDFSGKYENQPGKNPAYPAKNRPRHAPELVDRLPA